MKVVMRLAYENSDIRGYVAERIRPVITRS